MSEQKKQKLAHPSTSIVSVVHKGLLTPQASFLEDNPSQTSAGVSAQLKLKSSSRNLDSEEIAQLAKKFRLEAITVGLKDSKSETGASIIRLPRMDASKYFVWLDIETTDAQIPFQLIKILEVAVRITDKDFKPLDQGVSFLVHWEGKKRMVDLASEMPVVVIEMHVKSGLQHDYDITPEDKRMSLEDVERRVCQYIRGHGLEKGAIMAGAGIGFDRNMIRQHMPELDKLFHYQVFDTTTLWHLISRRYGREKRFKDSVKHRALDDVNGAIREAKLYADLVFKIPEEVEWPATDGI